MAGRSMNQIANRSFTTGEPAYVSALLEEAVAASDLAIAIIDLTAKNWPIIYVNKACEEVSGYSVEELLGQPCAFLHGPDTDPASLVEMTRAIRAGESLRIDVRNYKKTGEPFWNALHLSPLKGADGRPHAYLSVQQDVTRARALRKQEHHRQKVEALGRMAGGIAHEINNLLQPLLSLPELIADDLPDEASDAREHLDYMAQSARDARDLVSEILVYTRTAPTEGECLHIVSAVRGGLELISRSLNGRIVVDLREATEADPCIAGLSRAGLQQVLTNLVLNAAYAMDGGGTITVTIATEGSDLRLSVADTGCGMDERTQAQLFEPFFTTKPVGRGAGLGLYVVYDLVKRAGGRIAVSSKPGEGAEFSLFFPMSADQAGGQGVRS